MSWTVMSAIVKVPPKLGTVTSSRACRRWSAGRGGDVLAGAVRREVLRAADRAGRAHDREHLAGGVKRAGVCNGPVEGDVERAGRAVGDQVAVGTVAARHRRAQEPAGPARSGAGCSGLKRTRLRMLAAPKNRRIGPVVGWGVGTA